jgi:hypothetical protein
MKCKQAELLIIDSNEKDFKEIVKLELENHIRSCHSCATFVKKINSIRTNPKRLINVEPSDSLIESTLELCHLELKQKDQIVTSLPRPKLTTPNYIWATIIAIVTFSIIWFFPVLKKLIQENIISDHTIWFFVIIIQNIIMLLFAPIIFKKTRQKQQSFNEIVFL